jgi:hypothetical protein
MTLAEAMPLEFTRGEYNDTPAYALKDQTVKTVYSSAAGTFKKWPGPQKNVYFWVVLENYKRIGWNENPARGWSFPVLAAPLYPSSTNI